MSYLAQTTVALAACVLTVNSTAAEPLPCQGRYSAQSGNVTLSAEGMVHVEPRNRSEGTIDLTYDGCDRITVAGQGMRMQITRSATSGWTGTLAAGGATRIFHFNAVTPRLINSWMEAFGGGVTVQRGMKLTLLQGTENQPEDCVFDADQQNFSRENAAAQAFMEANGLVPPSPDFSLQDYFRATVVENRTQTETRKGSARHIRFMLGDDGAILPVARAAVRFREICRAEAGTLAPPRRMLDFKIVPIENPDGYAIFARVIDIETGKIIAQREGHVTGTDAEAMTLAMQDGAAQLINDGVAFGPLSDGAAR
ncbi:hypothetical protein J3456_18785 [Sulfitobacter sp. NFXS29]|uniref:hypothetical protein n=1 Tax=Sulfitobacter sp. NFXS29 TaxID=2818438 RepID=UPI0032DEF3A6